MLIPTNYEFENLYNSMRSPSSVHCRNTALVEYYTKYLLEKAISVFKFDGIPDKWAMNYFQYVLFGYGYVAIINTDKYGVIPQLSGLTGYNVFYQPTMVTIANPLLDGLKTLEIGTQCEIIKLQPNYSGVMDIVTTYADLMALCLETAGINLLNSKMSYIFFSQNKASAETFKKMYDKVASGEPMAVIDKALLDDEGNPAWTMFTQNVGQNYITDKILNDLQTIEDQFNTEIGIPNANTQKKERLIVDEVNANNIDTNAKIALWLETMQRDIEKVNDMFGLNLSVSYRFDNEFDNESEVEINYE